ncbi:MAG: acyl-CoA dehydrogenase family protein, partial [Bdellovibrionales bacterium]|nr:acyl-CoA dehydrogenase family protein [Bdellovibrionales bacterium]
LLQMVRNLEVERITLAAMSLGIARRCLEEMNHYSSKRESFGKPIRFYGQIQKHIAQSYGDFQAVRTYVYETARSYQAENEKNSGSGDTDLFNQRLQSDGVKLVASRVGKDIADRAIQVLGGYGYVGEYRVEQFWRDAKLLEIGGGTIEALEKNITKDLHGISSI